MRLWFLRQVDESYMSWKKINKGRNLWKTIEAVVKLFPNNRWSFSIDFFFFFYCRWIVFNICFTCCGSAAFMLCTSAPGFQGSKLIKMIDMYYYMNLPEGEEVKTKNTQLWPQGRKLHVCLCVSWIFHVPWWQKRLKNQRSGLEMRTGPDF